MCAGLESGPQASVPFKYINFLSFADNKFVLTYLNVKYLIYDIVFILLYHYYYYYYYYCLLNIKYMNMF